MILMLIGAAFAAGVHSGIPVQDAIEGADAPSFQTVETGWTTAVPDGGVVRVFVGRTEADAEDWYGRMLESLQTPPAELTELADVAHGDGIGLVLARDGNVGIMVRSARDARAWADRFLGAIVDDGQAGTWPSPPALRADGARWVVEAPNAVHVSFQGGRLARHAGLVFVQPPTVLVAWDGYGRATQQHFEDGAPISVEP